MKKSQKIWIGITSGVAVAAVAGSLLGVYIPQLLTKSNLDGLVEKQVKPLEGNNSYLRTSFKDALGTHDSDVGKIKSFATTALKSDSGYKAALNNVVDNYLTQFFKNFKGSDSYTERYKTWNDDINKEWDDLVKSYKDKHGGTWEYYFQVNILDPVGGNEDDWKREKLFTNVENAFNEFLFQNLYVTAIGKDDRPLTPTTNPDNSLKQYLFSDAFVNGVNSGERNKIQFIPNTNIGETTPYAGAIANLQSFIFDQYVAETLPLITTMTLYKHDAPQKDSKSNFFNVQKAKQINNPIELTDVVSQDGSYMWQTFAPKVNESDSSGEYVPTSTNKYLNFINNKNNLIDEKTGAINIPVENYTDDSATLYYVKMSDVFSSSYTQYAAASNYMLNKLLYNKTDANIPTAATLNKNLLNATEGTEIMGNFFSTSTKTGYFNLPQQVKDIINDDGIFKGGYNGQTAIADTVEIAGTALPKDTIPFIITRNESGVHIIGVDRYSKIKGATTYDGKINEIKNTILWRYALGQFGLNQSTGFNLDLKNELQTFFKENRDRLLFEYILKNETSAPAPQPKDYIFSNSFTDVNNIPKLSESSYKDYLVAWNIYATTLSKTKHKDLVKEKMLGLQSSYTDKLYGNSVINNGIAGVLPYTRDDTVNGNPTTANKGVVDKNYGMYNTLDVYKEDGSEYTETVTQTLLNNIENTTIPALYTKLETQNIGLKTLTYSSAKYNQYLEIGTANPPKVSSTEYISEGDILNDAVASWISGDEPKSMVEIQKLLSDINYDDNTNKNVLDSTNWALAGSYTDPYTAAAAPATPTDASDAATKRKYINYQLQKAYDINKKIPLVYEKMSQVINNGATYAEFIELARKEWASNILLNITGATTNTEYLKEIAALKYAFDYNEITGEYELTKFRDFLLEQTANYKKASYVWMTNERINILEDVGGKPYKDASTGVKELYKFKGNVMPKNAGAYGYAYQGAQGISTYRDVNSGLWKNTVTFNDNSNYFNNTKISPSGTTEFTGFTGMQFESHTSSDLNTSIKEDLFSASMRVFDGYNAENATSSPDISNIKIKGSLYNIGALDEFKNLINAEIYSWTQINQLSKWYSGTFGIDTSAVSKTNIGIAKTKLVELADLLPAEVFARNQSALLVNKNYDTLFPGASNNPAFYYAGNTNGYYNTAVITQFNKNDVIELFDHNGDKIIDESDVGINWTIANDANKGFLGSSGEAFFISAYNWYTSQVSFTATSFTAVIERQSKILAYDRRINNSFGKTLVENYKDDNTAE